MDLFGLLRWQNYQVHLFNSKERCVGALRMRLTAPGCGFIGLMLCGFLMSVNFSNNLIFAMTFLLFGIASVGWWQTRSNLRGLEVGGWRCEPVFAGQQVVYHLMVNNSSRMERYGLGAISLEFDGNGETAIPAQGQVEVTLTRHTATRGLLATAPASLHSCFPIGLFQANLATKELPECLVYPTPTGIESLPDQAQGQQAHMRRESGSFTDMRRYAPGDPPSRIAWKALARTDEVYTKEFDGAEGQPALWLTWDAVQAGGVEQKLSQLSRWVLDAHRQGREYGLDIPETQIAPASDDTHQRRCLRALALYGHAGPELAAEKVMET